VADVFTKKKRSQVMAAIRSKGNKATELKLVSIYTGEQRSPETWPGIGQ
jgi:G:T-mismatch repair DNA endonuclease (very short patch repair protein)